MTDLDALANRIQDLKIEIQSRVAGQREDYARIMALEAAARAVLPHLWLTAHTESLVPDADLCMGCGAERHLGHDAGCPVRALAALLAEEEA